MSNLERRPAELDARGAGSGAETGVASPLTEQRIEILEPREVPLGGPRAMTVRRTLPQRRRSLIGAWCFLDHYGPDEVRDSGGMRVPGHPHTGLATVTWLFEGEVEHRDTIGTVRVVRPGEVNLMTSGVGIAHSEYSTPETTRLHGAQLWLALPEASRRGSRRFQHHAAGRVSLDGGYARVFVGTLVGEASPIDTETPLVAAELGIDAGGILRLPIRADFEHGVLVDTGAVTVDDADATTDSSEGTAVSAAQLAYVPLGRDELVLRAGPEGARVLLIGGEPFGESIVMWWNFVGRSHEDIVQARADWQARVEAMDEGLRISAEGAGDFGDFPDIWTRVLPAPELPTVRLRPRD